MPDLVSPLPIRPLRRTELPADTVALARYLIGKLIVRELPGARLIGRIVETEAYPPSDPAAHHFRGPTPRNQSMYLRRGHAYVYFSYGNHFMLNVSAEIPGTGGGVLIRALEPLEGIAQMQFHRNTSRLRDLARGPGRLAAALQIDRSLDGLDLCAPGPMWLATLGRPSNPRLSNRHRPERTSPPKPLTDTTVGSPAGVLLLPRPTRNRIGKSPRIGITRAADRLLRFYEHGNPYVSGPARLNRT